MICKYFIENVTGDVRKNAELVRKKKRSVR